MSSIIGKLEALDVSQVESSTSTIYSGIKVTNKARRELVYAPPQAVWLLQSSSVGGSRSRVLPNTCIEEAWPPIDRTMTGRRSFAALYLYCRWSMALLLWVLYVNLVSKEIRLVRQASSSLISITRFAVVETLLWFLTDHNSRFQVSGRKNYRVILFGFVLWPLRRTNVSWVYLNYPFMLWTEAVKHTVNVVNIT